VLKKAGMDIVFFFLPIVAGVALTTQVGVNSQLREATNSPLTASFISFVVGTVALALIVLATRQPFPSLQSLGEISWHKYLGGLIGAVYVTIAIISAQRLSAANLFAFIVTGQMISALICDHYGWLGFKESPATLTRVGGAVLLVGGAYLINQK
jgi:bacterial/archaeal transporter family-2 protein